MVQQKVQLRKIRDFGENIADTFQFIKQEFKPLFSSFVLIAGVFIIGQGVFLGIFESNFFSIFDVLRQSPNSYAYETNAFQNIFTPAYFITIFLGLFTIEAMCVTVAAYMKAYVNSETSPTLNDVWQIFIRNIFRVVLYSIVIWLLICIGCVFCLVPGIYFMVVFAPFEIILIMEDCSFSRAFSRCFDLVKNNFWMSFGIYAVSYLIYSFASGIIGVFIGVLAGLISYFTTKDIGTTAGIVTGILGIFKNLFFIVFYISLCLNYFSLVEKTDATGMLERLQTLGTSEDPNAHIEEQF